MSKKMICCAKRVIPAIVAACLAAEAHAVACVSVSTGNWGVAARWSCNHVPAAGDDVTILNGHTITLNTSTNPLASLTVDSGGTLTTSGNSGSDLYLRGNLVNNGTINMQASSGTNTIYLAGANITSTFSGTGTWLLDNLDLNGTGGNFCTGGCKVELSGSPNLQFLNTSLFSGNSATYTFNALGNSTATVTLNSAGGQTVAAIGTTYPNLVLGGSGTKTMGTGNGQTINVLGSLTVNAGVTLSETNRNPAVTVAGIVTNSGTYTAGTGAHTFGGFVNAGTFTGSSGAVTISGDFSNSGTFTAGTSTVTLTGANSTLGGSATTTFTNLTVNKTAGNSVSVVCGTPSPTVSATLALTSGDIVTSGSSPGCAATCATQVPIIVAAAGTISGGSSASYVQGALRKMFGAGGSLNFRAAAGQDEFPVGDATNYTPIEITAGTTSTAGSVTACVTPADHPQVTTPVATTGIDAGLSVNRYWSLATATINTTAVPVDATFKFVAGDVDAGATAANFVVEDYNGTVWGPTTLVTAAAASTRAQNIDLTSATNDIAIGEPISGFIALPGQFNAFETATPAGAVLGMVQTKQSGVLLSVRLVRLNAAKNAVDTAYAQTGVTVELLDSSDNTGALNTTTACRPIGAAAGQWHPIAGTSQVVAFISGVISQVSFTVANSYRDVRVHVVKTGAGAGEGCSTDRFAIRPQSLTVAAYDADWATAGTARTLANTAATGGNVHKAGLAFTLRATPAPASATNYDGSPAAAAGSPTCATLCTTVGALSLTSTSWTTIPAGSGIRENATASYSEAGTFNLQLEDASYASVDAVDGSSAATRNVPATAIAVGRFVPDHFAFTLPSTPQFRTFGSAVASRSFTYLGQPFWYATLPSATVNAVNAAGVVTANYTGTLFKLAAAGITETYAGGANALDTALIGSASLTSPLAGQATYSAAAGGTLMYQRNPATPVSPFNAAIDLAVTATDNSESGVAGNGTITSVPLAFNGTGSGIPFDSGNEFRYGRLKLANAYGSELAALSITAAAQYYNAAGNWATNTADSATQFNTNLSPAGNVNAVIVNGPLALGNISIVAPGMVTLANGVRAFRLAAPGVAGSADLSIVTAPGYLLPGITGRATFGVYRGGNEFIYMRETYF